MWTVIRLRPDSPRPASGGPDQAEWVISAAGRAAKIGGMSENVGRDPQYEVFADEFAEHAEDGFYNAHYDRPACLSLLGEVAGRRVLDAACGPGLYAGELAARGAQVVGCDISERMVGLAGARVPAGEFRVHDLAEPLDWLPDSSVDLVLFALAVEYSTTGSPRCASSAACCGPAGRW